MISWRHIGVRGAGLLRLSGYGVRRVRKISAFLFSHFLTLLTLSQIGMRGAENLGASRSVLRAFSELNNLRGGHVYLLANRCERKFYQLSPVAMVIERYLPPRVKDNSGIEWPILRYSPDSAVIEHGVIVEF
jgi:hypothetical protein